MRRFREQTTETAGFYNTVGFNDDTRAFLSIPARHDVARRVDCAFLARWSPSTGSRRTRRTRSRGSSPKRLGEEGVPAMTRDVSKGRNSTHDPLWKARGRR